jgi:hypothetical protein
MGGTMSVATTRGDGAVFSVVVDAVEQLALGA